MGLFALPKLSAKKTKKLRKDKFSTKAKLAGFRARSAFKLIQIESKFNIFAKAKVCIDLCAAPGSWMQVASKYMKGESVVIGVDRCPIKSIPHTINILGDITTQEVREDLKKKLRDYEVDVVLHDGAPNVGKSWLHDAYAQNELVLCAFKLACEFLKRDGTFVTKIFRSKDHTSLEYVFKKLFKKVDSVKPSSSRFTSAEFFVVCRGFLKPNKMDPNFFNPKHVFLHMESEPKNVIDVMKPEKTKAKAVGYEEGITMLFKKLKLSDFILADNYIELLQEANEFTWDIPDDASDNKQEDVKDLISDIKVLGRKDLKALLMWRKKKQAAIKKWRAAEREELEAADEDEDESNNLKIKALEEAYAKVAALKARIKFVKEASKRKKSDEDETEKPKPAEGETEENEEFQELEQAQEEINRLKAKLVSEVKNKVKKVSKRKAKLIEKMRMRQMMSGGMGPVGSGSVELFQLDNLENVDNLDAIANDANMDTVIEEEKELKSLHPKNKKKLVSVAKDMVLDKTGKNFMRPDDSESEEESSDDEDAPKEQEEDDVDGFLEKLGTNIQEKEDKLDTLATSKNIPIVQNPLLLDLVGDAFQEREERKAEEWFCNSVFGEVETEAVEDCDFENATSKAEADAKKIAKNRLKQQFDAEEFKEDDEEDQDQSDEEMEEEKEENDPKEYSVSFSDNKQGTDGASDTDTSDEEEPQSAFGSRKRKKSNKGERLTIEEKALATKMIKSAKAKRDIIDAAWNKNMRDLTGAPKWFLDDEAKFNSPAMDVDEEDVEFYRDAEKPVNAKSIKKAVEAQARKKMRIEKKMKKYRTKAKAICGRLDITERERAVELKKISKDVSKKKKEKKYVVMKKRMQGKRPQGEKGRMVDARLKSDKRPARNQQKKGKKRK